MTFALHKEAADSQINVTRTVALSYVSFKPVLCNSVVSVPWRPPIQVCTDYLDSMLLNLTDLVEKRSTKNLKFSNIKLELLIK